MATITEQVNEERQAIVTFSTEFSQHDDSAQRPGRRSGERFLGSLFRSRVLFLRSALAAIASVVSALPNFSHSHLQRILSAALPLYDLDVLAPVAMALGAGVSLTRDVERCLSLVTAKIPIRLCLPELRESCGSSMGYGHKVSLHFAKLVGAIWETLDRPAVVAHMQTLCGMGMLLLDYRRAFGDLGSAADLVEETVVAAVGQFSLKLTESELRSFLVRLADWKDIVVSGEATGDGQAAAGTKTDTLTDPLELETTKKRKSTAAAGGEEGSAAAAVAGEAGDAITAQQRQWSQCSRSVCFYRLLSSLGSKLRGIFVPSMAIFWGSAAEAIGSFTSLVESSSDGAKKKKKQKKAALLSAGVEDGDGLSGGQVISAGLLQELRNRASYALEAVRLACVHGSAAFVDEVRFS